MSKESIGVLFMVVVISLFAYFYTDEFMYINAKLYEAKCSIGMDSYCE